MKKLENLGLSVCNIFTVDWVTCSFSNTDVYSVISVLNLDQSKFSFEEKYCWGYPCTATFGNIRIFYTPDDREYPNAHKGCCLNMSGQACREFETFSRSLDWPTLFSRLDLLDGNVTRLDLAYDDRTGVILLPRLAMDIADRNFIGHARRSERLYSDNIDDDIQGLTVYVGSKKSALFIRIYDKAAERGFHPSECHWVRVEIQMRDDRAMMAARSVATDPNIGNVFAGILSNYLRVLQPTCDSNKSRWPTAEYWQQILHDVASLRLTTPGIEYNFRKAEVNFVKQYHQFLRTYKKIYGADAPQKLFQECDILCEGENIKEKYKIAEREAAAYFGEVISSDQVQNDLNDHVQSVNSKLILENKQLNRDLAALRGMVADLKKDLNYRDAETISFDELLSYDPDLPW